MDAAPSSSSAAKEESAIFSCHESLGDLSAWWRRTAATLSTADGSAGLLGRDERGGAAGVRVGGARRGCFGGHGAYYGVMVLIMVLGLNRAGLAGVDSTWMVNPLGIFYCVEFYTIASKAAAREPVAPRGQCRLVTLALGLQLKGIITQMMLGKILYQ